MVIIPGFMAGRRSAVALHHVMRAAGWDAVVAPVGRNAGPAQHSVDAAEATLLELSERSGEPVRVVGHSRGGQFSRILGVRHPDRIAQVISVGTPLTVKYPSFVVVRVPAEALDALWRRGTFGHVDIDREQAVDDQRYLPFPSSIDFVSVWSRSDGIVDWRLCIEHAAVNVEVRASHLGLINSVAGIQGIAAGLDRL